ncbi:MAG: hypothetical protein WC560_00445 [Syntrophales bacterium]
MWRKIKDMIPRETLVNLLICLAGVLLIVFAGIIPNYLASAKLVRKIGALQFQSEEQKTYHPIYQSLKSRSEKKMSSVLPFPDKTKLSREAIGVISITFRNIAKNTGMNIVSISPDLNSTDTDHNFLPVEIIIAGDFPDLRGFLIALGGVPYLEHIEEIQIQQNREVMEFKVKTILALSQ